MEYEILNPGTNDMGIGINGACADIDLACLEINGACPEINVGCSDGSDGDCGSEGGNSFPCENPGFGCPIGAGGLRFNNCERPQSL